MSIEALVLLALFLLLPLIERLLRSARQPNGGAPDRPADARRSASRPAMRPSPPQERSPEEARVPRMADVPPVSASPTARRSPRLQLPAPGARRPGRQGLVVEDLRHPLTLRRAVVLMTILGPCRSVAPHEWTGASGSAGRG
jgi:hypothetical protein